LPSMLTDDDVARFRADGYLLPGRQLFAAEKLAALEAIFDEHLADKGDKLSDELDTPHLPDTRLPTSCSLRTDRHDHADLHAYANA
jgi:hypothetical protein